MIFKAKANEMVDSQSSMFAVNTLAPLDQSGNPDNQRIPLGIAIEKNHACALNMHFSLNNPLRTVSN